MTTILYATLFVLLVPAPTLTSVDGSVDEARMGRLTRSRSHGLLTTERQA